jgi:hypothetical protein
MRDRFQVPQYTSRTRYDYELLTAKPIMSVFANKPAKVDDNTEVIALYTTKSSCYVKLL